MTALAGLAAPGSYAPASTAWVAEMKAAVLEGGADQANGGTDGDLAFTLPDPEQGSHDGLKAALLFSPTAYWPGDTETVSWSDGDSLWTDDGGEAGKSLDSDPGRVSGEPHVPHLTMRSVSLGGSEEGAPAGPETPLSSAAPAQAGAQSGSAASPVVAPSVVSVHGSFTPDAQANAFRITRTPAGDTALEVRYTLAAYSSTGAVSQPGVAVLSPGSVHVDVPIEPTPAAKGGPEIVALTVEGQGNYQVAQPTATLVLAGSTRSCSEAALFEAYREGKSEEAFGVLVERNHPTVLQTCYRLLGNWHDAEDVSQLVFLALAQQQLRLHTTLAGWLRTVARNAAIVFLRSRNRRSRHEQQAAKPVQVPSEEDAHDQRDEVDAALARIPGPLREAVRLRYLEGLSQAEAAQLIGCPRGTLSQRAAHGVARLRNLLGGGSD